MIIISGLHSIRLAGDEARQDQCRWFQFQILVKKHEHLYIPYKLIRMIQKNRVHLHWSRRGCVAHYSPDIWSNYSWPQSTVRRHSPTKWQIQSWTCSGISTKVRTGTKVSGLSCCDTVVLLCHIPVTYPLCPPALRCMEFDSHKFKVNFC